MDWSTPKIIDTVEKLRKDSIYLSEKDIKEKYKDFMDNFPKLYYSSLSHNFNIETLKSMLKYRDESRKNNVPDLVRDVTIGEEMAKKYLYPVVGNPSNEDKKKAMKKVAQKYYSSQ